MSQERDGGARGDPSLEGCAAGVCGAQDASMGSLATTETALPLAVINAAIWPHPQQGHAWWMLTAPMLDDGAATI